ncbi:MAG: glutathione S-transferase [Pseudomonadales bacterium]
MLLPVLYSFRRCPYAIRARLALCYSGITVELREILLRDKPASMLKYSAKGTVPVLVLENGTVIDESIDIVRWALSVNDPDGWLATLSDTEVDRANQLIDSNDFSFKPLLDRYKYADRYPEKNAAAYRSQAEVFLIELEQRLSRHRYIIGNTLSIADMAIFPFIRQFVWVDKNWFDQTHYLNLQRWLDSRLQSILFNRVMTKWAQWLPGDKPIIFPG